VKYALFVYDVPSFWDSLSEEEKHAVYGEYHAVSDSPGIVAHYRLQPPQMTTTVLVEEGQTLTAEGPLADTREILAGFYVLESDDREAVLNVASMTRATAAARSVARPDRPSPPSPSP
jgi:hypothetical protein